MLLITEIRTMCFHLIELIMYWSRLIALITVDILRRLDKAAVPYIPMTWFTVIDGVIHTKITGFQSSLSQMLEFAIYI